MHAYLLLYYWRSLLALLVHNTDNSSSWIEGGVEFRAAGQLSTRVADYGIIGTFSKHFCKHFWEDKVGLCISNV